jgi:hypothetical protein
MEFLSTTSLANDHQLAVNELFNKFKSFGWIDRKKEKWILTNLGKEKGGQMKTNQKFGEYIVWPENISIDNNQSRDKSKLINATAIGKHFNVSSQRINLILAELGWIEKDVAGWEITKLGKTIGGKQFEHETSGGYYALWPITVLQNKSLVEVFKESPVESQSEIKSEAHAQNMLPPASVHTTMPKNNFREKFEAKYRTIDGHYVRSKAEMLIDNWLYQYGLIHAYERKLPIEEDVYCDFYIPSGIGRTQAVYIEYWGLENDPKYQERKKKKIDIYNKEGFSLIELTDDDILNIDDLLPKKLLKFKIKVG